MKKIMFNDKYGLTQAVLEGRKTQTRRIVTYPKTFHGKDVCGFYVCKRVSDGVVTDVCMYDENESFIDDGQILPNYKVGEIVAIAQSYKDAGYSPDCIFYRSIAKIDGYKKEIACCQKGWNNKMFVAPNLMPHKIRITNVRIERLQDISDKDCMSEGIQTFYFGKCKFPPDGYTFDNGKSHFDSPREAYSVLIDKLGKKGDWEKNPYVFVYDFELVK